jgi:hypothetical protein
MLSARIMLGDSGDRVNRTSTLVSRIANALRIEHVSSTPLLSSLAGRVPLRHRLVSS